MGESQRHVGLLAFLHRLLPVLTAVSVVLTLVFAVHFLVERLGSGGTGATVATVALLVVAGGETVAASALARLKPAAWTVGLVTFAVATGASLALLFVESRALSAAYVAVNLAVVAAVFRMRPLYTPESEQRQRALAGTGEPGEHARLRRLRRSAPDPEVRLFVAFVLLAAAVTFYKGVKLYFQPNSLSTVVGAAYLGFALLQARACYGLWLRNGRGWLLSMLLCSVATLVAAYHALVAEDFVSFVIVIFDASNVAYLYRIRQQYVGEIAIGRPPE